ncbi:MAG: hypothetical protein IJC46_01055 [Clostridia bacterium]|nr:hypothetical protein [Clostridia bacterium]
MKKRFLLILLCVAVLLGAASCNESMIYLNDYDNLHTQKPDDYVFEIDERIVIRHGDYETDKPDVLTLIIRNAFLVEENVVQVNYQVKDLRVKGFGEVEAKEFTAYDCNGVRCIAKSGDGEYTQYQSMQFYVETAGDYVNLEFHSSPEGPAARIRAYYDVGAKEVETEKNPLRALLMAALLVIVAVLTVLLVVAKKRKKKFELWLEQHYEAGEKGDRS